MFGKGLRQSQFTYLDSRVTPVNHGSYGLPPKPVVDTFFNSMKNDLSFPDKYMFQTQSPEYEACLKALAGVVGTSYQNLAIVDNATSGINIVYRSMKWSKGDKVIVTSLVYDSCEHVLRFMEKLFGIEVIKLDLELDDEKILQQFEEAIAVAAKSGNPIKLCMFDLVSSMPAYLFPVDELVALCKKNDIISVVDGAHGVGLVPFKLDSLGADYFVSNLHKWFFCPRATAFLYVDPKHHKSIQPFPISHEYFEYEGDDTLVKKFKFSASDNYAKLNCVAVAKEFRDSLGGDEAIWKYTTELRDKTTKWLCDRWGTKVFGNEINQMANVIVPESFLLTLSEYDEVRTESIKEFHYFQVGKFKDTYVFRLSFQVYNEFEDYVKSIEKFEQLVTTAKLAKL